MTTETTESVDGGHARPAGFRTGFRAAAWAVYPILLALSLLLFLPGQFSLPPTDRDEARFAQATRQMLESGDFIDIRFQDEARHKKPAGIYWLQSAAVSLAGGPEQAGIWAYRLPSLLGATAAVLLTAWIGSILFGPAAGLIGGALLAGTVLLGVEARIAKTDAVLLAAILAAQGFLARAWLGRNGAFPLSWAEAGAFWAAIGFGILIKGPIILLVVGGTALALVLTERRAGWLKRLRPWPGVLIALALTLPWLAAITIETGGGFFAEAVGHDLMGKVAGGQEGKGFPPGYYTLLFPVTFWPATLFALPALAWTWQRRRDPAIRFCLAWIVPTWLVFEAVPTKLFHYVLPVYPALALLVGAAVLDGVASARRGLLAGSLALWALVGLVLTVGMGALPLVVDENFDGFAALAASNVALVLVGAAWLAWRKRFLAAIAASSLGALLLYALAFTHVLPGLSAIWLSPRLVAAVAAVQPCPGTVLASAGYSEPSLVFLAGTETVLTTGAGAARHLMDDPACAVAAVEERQRAEFDAALAAAGRTAQPLVAVEGVNYNKGDRVVLTVFRLE